MPRQRPVCAAHRSSNELHNALACNRHYSHYLFASCVASHYSLTTATLRRRIYFAVCPGDLKKNSNTQPSLFSVADFQFFEHAWDFGPKRTVRGSPIRYERTGLLCSGATIITSTAHTTKGPKTKRHQRAEADVSAYVCDELLCMGHGARRATSPFPQIEVMSRWVYCVLLISTTQKSEDWRLCASLSPLPTSRTTHPGHATKT